MLCVSVSLRDTEHLPRQTVDNGQREVSDVPNEYGIRPPRDWSWILLAVRMKLIPIL